MKVELYGKKYYAKKNGNNSPFLYKNILCYILDIPSVSLSMMYEMHNNRTKER